MALRRVVRRAAFGRGRVEVVKKLELQHTNPRFPPLPRGVRPALAAYPPTSTAALKLQPDRLDGVNGINGYDARGVVVNGQIWRGGVLIPWQGDVRVWAEGGFEALATGHFEQLAALQPELVILGTGARQRFVHPNLTRALLEQRIGVECMDNPAACRTYNVLVGEGRQVIVALLTAGA